MLFFIVFIEFNDHIIGTLLRYIGEIVGRAYLFLKEQLLLSAMPTPSGMLHGNIIAMLAL